MNDHADARRPALLSRRRLLQRLAGLWKVALLSAPAGYGKTTLAAQYAKGRRVLWCRLDPEDRDLAHFLDRLLTSGNQLDPPAFAQTHRLFRARRDMERDGGLLLASLIAELARSSGALVIVLDDAHVLAGAREVWGLLRRLIEETATNTRLLLCCRGASPIPLARYEMEGKVVRIDVSELEFDETEQALFLKRTRQIARADDPHIAFVRTSLRGWPAGFALLAASSARKRPPQLAGEDDARRARLFRYLAEEMFLPLPAELQRDLCRASLLDELEPAALAKMLGRDAAARLLKEASKHELLMRGLPDRPEVLALHPLFLEFLKTRRGDLLRESELRSLGRALADRLMKAGEAAKAIRTLLDVAEPARAIAVFDSEATRAMAGGLPSQLDALAIELLGDASTSSLAQASPYVLSAAASVVYREGRFTEAAAFAEAAGDLWLERRAYLELARDARLLASCAWVAGSARSAQPRLESLLTRTPKRQRLPRAILTAEIGGLRILGGERDQARRDLAMAERALRNTPHERHLIEARIHGANLFYSEGHWDQYLAIAQRAIAFYRRIGVPGRIQALLINMAEARTYLGEEDRAIALLDEAEAMQSRVMQQNLVLIHLARARALVERGDFEAAADAIQVARASAARHGAPLWELQVELWAGVLNRKRGRLEAAERHLSSALEGFRSIDAPAWTNLALMELGLVRGLLRQSSARALLDAALRASRRLGDRKEAARNLLYQARVVHAAGEDASSILRRALRAIEKEQYLVLLRKESDAVRRLVRDSRGVPANLRALVLGDLPSALDPRVEDISVRLLGSLEVKVDGRSVTFARRASMQLLARLSIRPGRTFRREELAEALWPGASQEASRNRFDVALNGLRRVLEPNAGPRGPFRVIESDSGWCRLSDAVRVDVREFEHAAEECESLVRALSPTMRMTSGPRRASSRHPTAWLRRAEKLLEQAMARYRGDLELDLSDWAEAERERLRAQFQRIVLGHGLACFLLRDLKRAEADALRLLTTDSLDENAERLLLSALVARGEHLVAVRRYRDFARRMRRELGVSPSPETIAIVEPRFRLDE